MAQNDETVEAENIADSVEERVAATETPTDAVATAIEDSAAGNDGGSDAASADNESGVSLDKVAAILDSDADAGDMPKNMQRLMTREADNNKRVQKSIKGAKTNSRWFVPVFVALLVVGLLWVVVNYLTGGSYPIPTIGNWNLLIGFGLMLIGFIMTMWWN